MEIDSGLYHILALALLITSSVIQLISLIAPGWAITKDGYTENYKGIFFYTTCSKYDNRCVTTSYHDDHHKEGISSPVSDLVYHKRVIDQTLAIITVVSSLACLGIHEYRACARSEKYFPSLAAVIVTLMTFTGSLMLTRLLEFYVYVHYLQQDEKESGFPYCGFIYTIAFVANVIVAILYVIKISTLQREHATEAGGFVLSSSYMRTN